MGTERGHTLTGLVPFVSTGLLIGAGLLLSNFAFTWEVKQKMLRRDNYECQALDDHEHCRGQLEAAHLNHDKSRPEYGDMQNGLILCIYHHLAHHIRTQGCNGLNRAQNRWAIEKLKERLPDP